MEVQIPVILLRKNSLEVLGWFRPETMSLQLSERQSSATLTVGPEAPEIGVGDWMQDDTEPGMGIVWRVRTVDTSYDKATRTVTLEHMIQSLKDLVLFGEHTAAMMGGGDTCTARQAAEYILARSPQWTLGEFAYGTVRNAYSFNGDDLLNALTTVSGTLEDPWWEYDFSSYPFRLSVRPRADTVGAEMRMSRNISTAKMTVDRSRMYTRIYPIGENNLHISGEYLSRNEEIYGTICKVQTDQSKGSEAALRSWAGDLLRRHADPYVTVSITGLDLSRETGEPLDSIRLGKKCRVPLPGYGTTITETVSRLQWSDKLREPEKITVTLANEVQDVQTIVNRLTATSSATSGSAGRSGAKKAQKDNAWFTDEAEFVAMTARKVFGTDDIGQIAQIKVDGDGITGTVQRTEKGVITARSEIKQLKDSISLVVDGAGVVTPASLILAINGNRSTAKLSADQIVLEGSTLISSLLTGKATFSKIAAANIVATNISIGQGSGSDYTTNSLTKAIREIKIVPSGNDYTLQTRDFSGGNWKTAGNFSRATNLSGSWSRGILTVSAAPQNQQITANLSQGVTIWDGNYAAVQVMATDSDKPGSNQYTGRDMYVDATARYRAGQATRPTLATSTSERPSGATDLQTELYISASIKTITIRIGSNLWYCKVSK